MRHLLMLFCECASIHPLVSADLRSELLLIEENTSARYWLMAKDNNIKVSLIIIK